MDRTSETPRRRLSMQLEERVLSALDHAYHREAAKGRAGMRWAFYSNVMAAGLEALGYKGRKR